MGVISSEKLSEHHRQLTAQRFEHAQVIYNQGILFLKQAHSKKFQNPEHLQEAGKAFLRAHQITPDNPNPDLAFAYILLLLENHTLARQYAMQVLEKNPQDRFAQTFVKRIESDLLGEDETGLPVSDLDWGYNNASLSFTLQPLETLISNTQASLRLCKGFASMYKWLTEDISAEVQYENAIKHADLLAELEKRK